MLPEAADARAALEATARRVLERRRLPAHRDAAFEYTDVFARGVGESTDIVQKEMYTFDDGGGRSVTLRPEGTAPICRAYAEHGMHKLPQPVKLWYLSSFFRQEKPQAGRFRQFWQIGAEALGSDDPAVDAEIDRCCSRRCSPSSRSAACACGSRSLGTLAARARLPRASCRPTCARTPTSCPSDVRARIDLNPLRAFDSDHPGTRAVMEDAPLLLDRLDADDAEHFAAVRELLDRAEVDYEVDPTLVRGLDYYTRTVFEFTSDALGAQSGVAGGGRYDGLVEHARRPADARLRLRGRDRADAARVGPACRSAPPPVDLYVAFDGAGAARGGVRGRRRGPPTRA